MEDWNRGDGAQQVNEILACSFDRWYKTFADVTFRSRVLSLTEDVASYLQADGVHVPRAAAAAAAVRDDVSDSSSNWGDGVGEDEDDECCEPSFPELESAIDQAIRDFGGAVLPKLNWSAPKDARWLLGGLRCDSVQDVFTLLKSSDFIAHDLCHAFDDCCDAAGRTRPDVFCLVLREWRSVDEGSEFRCFVRDGRLRAISQRHTSLFFPYLIDQSFTDPVVEQIESFFHDAVLKNFPLERYVFDVFVGKPPRRKVKLIDFSPWGGSTDPLLFDWDELQQQQQLQAAVEFRTIGSEMEKRAKIENYHCLPLEVAELGSKSPDEIAEICRRAEANLGTS